jgi:integrase
MTRPDNKAPAVREHPGARHQEVPLMQLDRTPRRVRIAPNLYEGRGARKGEHRYEVGFADIDGRWRMKTLKASTRTEAKAERDAFLSALRRGEIVAPSKLTVKDVVDEYLEYLDALVAAGERGERTAERYRQHLLTHVVPEIGRLQIQKVTPETIVRLVARCRSEKGLASWTVKGMLTPLNRVFALAVRNRYIADNPIRRLEASELPSGKTNSPPRTLSREEIEGLLRSSPVRYRPMLATAVFAGLRLQELLGLRWLDVDFKAGVVRVRTQLTRGSKTAPPRLVALKTKAARRDIVLLPELSSLLHAHLRGVAQARGLPRQEDYVFTTSEGTPLNYRNLCTRGLDKAAAAAGLNPPDMPKLTMHDLRHTFASHLIRQGIDPVRASRQLGHARPSITLDIYAHEFDEARGRDDIADKLTAAFSGLLGAGSDQI